jgi:hypothetical protein
MLLILSLVVFIGAIIVCFSTELINIVKKIHAIPGVSIFLPLIVASSVLIRNQSIVCWCLIHTQIALYVIILHVMHWLPFTINAYAVARIIILFTLTLLPMLLMSAWRSYKNYQPFTHAWLVGLMIWLILAMLLTINLNESA